MLISSKYLNRCRLSTLIVIIVLCVGIAPSVWADSFNYNVSLRAGYDDNIINYSDADLDQMDDTSASENKFAIESKDDFIIISKLEAVLKTNIAGHSTHFGIRGAYYYYQDNDIKRYYKAGGFIKRYLKKGVYLQTSFGYIPDYYYRNSYSSTAGYQEAKFDKITAEVKFSAVLFNSLRGNLYYYYSSKDFIPLFDERDITSHSGEIQLIYRPAKLCKVWGSYNYITAKGAGADNVDFRRDTSYDSNLLSLGLRFYLQGIASQKFELAGNGSYKIIYFRTIKITNEDRYRIGRTDYRSSFSFSVKHYMSSKFSIGITFNRIIKTTNLPAEDLKAFLEYSSNSYYSILSFAF
ncbi:MAG: hypothetical protein J7K40_04785 [candidate division Zixibacteria bacterium]|nr:hypothetical protein [candidate division Zixibacteria bacterium]